jgi:hypothetical protein
MYSITTIINSTNTVIITDYLNVGINISVMLPVLESKDISGFNRVLPEIFVE